MFRVIRDHWLPDRGARREHRLVRRLRHSTLVPAGCSDRDHGERHKGKGNKGDEVEEEEKVPGLT